MPPKRKVTLAQLRAMKSEPKSTAKNACSKSGEKTVESTKTVSAGEGQEDRQTETSNTNDTRDNCVVEISDSDEEQWMRSRRAVEQQWKT